MPWVRKSIRPSFGRLLLEDADELVADAPALLLRILDAGQTLQGIARGVDHHEVHAEVPLERDPQQLRLALAHEPVVDVDARQPVPDGAVDERRRDRRIDAARERADDAPVGAGLPRVLSTRSRILRPSSR